MPIKNPKDVFHIDDIVMEKDDYEMTELKVIEVRKIQCVVAENDIDEPEQTFVQGYKKNNNKQSMNKNANNQGKHKSSNSKHNTTTSTSYSPRFFQLFSLLLVCCASFVTIKRCKVYHDNIYFIFVYINSNCI